MYDTAGKSVKRLDRAESLASFVTLLREPWLAFLDSHPKIGWAV